MAESWYVSMLGTVRAERERGGVCITKFGPKKTPLLLAYLVLEKPREPKSRADLAALFWPENGPANLRKALHHLRHLNPTPALAAPAPAHSEGENGSDVPNNPTQSIKTINLLDDLLVKTVEIEDALVLTPGRVGTDVDDFEDALRQAGRATDPAQKIAFLNRATALYRGPFLNRFEVHTLALSDWIVEKRSALAWQWHQALRTLAALHEAAGDLAAALAVARRAAKCDPVAEGIGDAEHLAAIDLALRLAVACHENQVALEVYRKRADLEDVEPLSDPALAAHLERLRAEADRLQRRRLRAPRPDQDLFAQLLTQSLGRLEPADARFYARLSVFPGRFTLEQAARICGTPDAAARLAALAKRSLVLGPDGTGRYRLPEAARDLAGKRLRPTQRERLAKRLALLVFGQVQAAFYHPDSQQNGGANPALFPDEQDNLDAALTWMLAEGHDRWRGTHLLVYLEEHWNSLALFETALRWTEVALTHESDADADLGERRGLGWLGNLAERGAHHRYQLHLLAGRMAMGRSDHAAAIRSLQAAVDWARRCPFPSTVAWTLHDLGNAYHHNGQSREAQHCFEEALPVAEAHGGPSGAVGVRANLARSLLLLGNVAAARTQYEACLKVHRADGRKTGIAGVQYRLGGLHLQVGEYSRARHCLDEALSHFHQVSEHNGVAECLWQLARVDLDLGNGGLARYHLDAALRILEEHGKGDTRAAVLGTLGDWARVQGRWNEAATLYAEGLAHWQHQNRPHWTAQFLVRQAELALVWQSDPSKKNENRLDEGEDAEALCRQALALCCEPHALLTRARALRVLGRYALRAARLEDARTYLTDSLAIDERFGHRPGMARGQEALVLLALAEEKWAEAAACARAAAALRDAMGTPLPPSEQPEQDAARAQIQRIVGEPFGNREFPASPNSLAG